MFLTFNVGLCSQVWLELKHYIIGAQVSNFVVFLLVYVITVIFLEGLGTVCANTEQIVVLQLFKYTCIEVVYAHVAVLSSLKKFLKIFTIFTSFISYVTLYKCVSHNAIDQLVFIMINSIKGSYTSLYMFCY